MPIKLLFIFILFLTTLMTAHQDTLFVDEIIRTNDANTIIFLDIKGKYKYEVTAGLLQLKYYIYDQYFCKKYSSFREFLLRLFIGNGCIPEKILKQAMEDYQQKWKQKLEFARLKKTKIWRSRKRGLDYLISKYTHARPGLLEIDYRLSYDERNDLSRIMFRNGYVVILDSQGVTRFYKPPRRFK